LYRDRDFWFTVNNTVIWFVKTACGLLPAENSDMDAERFKKIDEIFDAALELEEARRAVYLQQVCGTDSDLRREVESLFEARNQVGNFIQTPAFAEAAKSLAEHHPISLIGHSIKHYRILSLAGAGGMGEVYLGEDTQLGRRVALKILPAQFTRDPDRIARFQRESRAASALNHPNIITIHEIGQDNNLYFIVTEFIEGDTLRKKMSQGKLNLKEAIEITLQIASALEAAHNAGIIHRDIKPENIMLRRDGYVKVLDFGLAKLTEKRKSEGGNGSHEHHLSTETGIVMGTLSYMSPEQATGQEVDHRTDIFSLGVVFYEMVTGKNPFKREHLAATLNAILEEQPEALSSSNPDVSLDLERLMTRMLDKEKEFRYQTAADLRASLRRMQRGIDSGITASANQISTTQPAAAKKQVSRWWRMAALGLLVSSLLLLVSWLFFPRSQAGKKPADWQFARIQKITDSQGLEYFPSLSPDGKSLIYASDLRGNYDIYLQSTGTNKIINLTEDSSSRDTDPAFSPDGTRIAFHSNRNGGGIFLMKETGESVKQLTNSGFNPTWSPDGRELAFVEDEIVIPAGRRKFPSRLMTVTLATGETRVISESDATQPNWSPNGKRIAYYAGEPDKRGIWTIRPDGSEAKPVHTNSSADTGPVWGPDGKSLYFTSLQNGVPAIWRIAIDEASGETSGASEFVPTPAAFAYQISFSRDGRHMAFSEEQSTRNTYRWPCDLLGKKSVGEGEQITRTTGTLFSPSISPDGQTLVFEKRWKMFTLKIGSTIPYQLIEVEGNTERRPHWSPDGRHIAFEASFTGTSQIYVINPDGSGQQQITNAPPPGVIFAIWSPDSKRLAYTAFFGKTYIMDLTRPFDQQTPEETPNFPNSEAYFSVWDWSPDGKYLAGIQSSNGTDIGGVYIYSLENKTYEQISDLKLSQMSSRPLWLNDSRHLLFNTSEKILLADIQSKKIQEIEFPEESSVRINSLTKDNRYFYGVKAKTESEIWMLSLQ
jgi:eukaryotic-like serine/threonine-protein kinase